MEDPSWITRMETGPCMVDDGRRTNSRFPPHPTKPKNPSYPSNVNVPHRRQEGELMCVEAVSMK